MQKFWHRILVMGLRGPGDGGCSRTVGMSNEKALLGIRCCHHYRSQKSARHQPLARGEKVFWCCRDSLPSSIVRGCGNRLAQHIAMLVAWCPGGMVSWWHGVLVAWCPGGMVVWCAGGMVAWCHTVLVHHEQCIIPQ